MTKSLLSLTSLPLLVLILTFFTQNNLPAQNTRDPWLWPFASNSIWNVPVGSEAVYVPANLRKAQWIGVDVELMFKVPVGSPERQIYVPGAWGPGRCSGTEQYWWSRSTMPIPDNLIVGDASATSTPNNCSAFLLPDGKTLVQLNPLARCTAGGNVYGYVTNDTDIFTGDGRSGGHGGSGMSTLGGSVRKGELTSLNPIRHAIKINLWGEKDIYYSSSKPGFRWPAWNADSYADPATHGSGYKGTNPAVLMGSLLALLPTATAESLGIVTPAGKKIFYALQNFGAYIVDDTAWEPQALCMEDGVVEEYQQVYGAEDFYSAAVQADLIKMFTSLQVIDNNGPDRIGGGGTPRAPLACDIGTVGSVAMCSSNLRAPENPSNTIAGLNYSYYEHTGYSQLPDFSKITATKTGTVTNFDLSVRNRNDNFAFQYKGFITIPTDGNYTFSTNSDDGSRLYLGNTLVVDNDKSHGPVEVSGTIGLKAGKHAITVTFFENGGGEILKVSYAGPGIAKQSIPATALSRATNFSGFYKIIAKHSRKALDVKGGNKADGDSIVQWTAHSGDNQQWSLEDVGGYYKIIVKHSSKALDLQYSGLANGIVLQQSTDSGAETQKWKIEDVGEGYYRIINKFSNKALDVSKVSMLDGAYVHQWEYLGQDNQKWMLQSAISSTNARVSTENRTTSLPSVYPNPAKSEVTVHSTSELQGLKLLTRWGRVVLQKNNLNTTQVSLDTRNLLAGMYLIEIKTKDGKTSMSRVIIIE